MTNQTTIAYEVCSICYDLDADVDENELDLPKHLVIEVPQDEQDIESYLADKISDKSGYCVWQFEFKPYKQK